MATPRDGPLATLTDDPTAPIAAIRENPRIAPLLVGVVVSLFFLLRHAFVAPFAMDRDPIFWEFGGWYVLQGAAPYVEIWDVKPVMVWLVTPLLALLSGGDVHLLHALSMSVSWVAMMASTLFVVRLTGTVTDDDRAAAIAGFAFLTLPAVFIGPFNGIRPKLIGIAFGLAALLLVFRYDRPGAAGAFAAAAAGFWQMLIVFPLIAAVAVARRGRRDALRFGAGAVLLTAAALVPFALWGALESMFVEVVLVPILVTEGGPSLGSFLDRGVRALTMYVLAGPVFSVAAVGLLGLVNRSIREYWWIVVGCLWAALQVFVLDFEAADDMLLVTVFAAVALGAAAAEFGGEYRRHLLIAVAALAVINPVVALGPDLTNDFYYNHEFNPFTTGEAPSPEILRLTEMFLEKRTPETCHIRMSAVEEAWIARTGADRNATVCGKLSSVG